MSLFFSPEELVHAFLLKLKMTIVYVCQENDLVFVYLFIFCWKCLLSDRVAYCFESLEKRRVIYGKSITIIERKKNCDIIVVL